MGTDEMMIRQNVKSRDILSMWREWRNSIMRRENDLDELQHPLETPRKTRICQARKITRKSKQYEFRTQPAHNDYQLVINKRVLRAGPPSRILADTDLPRKIRSQTIVLVSLRCYTMTNWLNLYWISMRRIETLASSRRQSCRVRVRGVSLLCMD